MSRIDLVYPEERSVDVDTILGWARDAYANGEIDHEPEDLLDAIDMLEDAGEITVRASCRNNLRSGDGSPPHDAATASGMYDRDF